MSWHIDPMHWNPYGTEIPTIIDPSAAKKYPSGTGNNCVNLNTYVKEHNHKRTRDITRNHKHKETLSEQAWYDKHKHQIHKTAVEISGTLGMSGHVIPGHVIPGSGQTTNRVEVEVEVVDLACNRTHAWPLSMLINNKGLMLKGDLMLRGTLMPERRSEESHICIIHLWRQLFSRVTRRMYIYMYICMCMFMFMYRDMNMYTYVYMYVYIHKYMHMYVLYT